ncbi:leucyl aminopeptidase [Gemmobacter megaterium]|uniref:Leucyl aminopeptidase n=1 Tax=Gemmobacter megaterium TaxID=1086013 RepID=A0A1N7M7S5_9RHOB|nr:leucyl aminopeptidase family protein [Gemmobacter megaterium]GGE08376.1 leucyl aminopeptidase [Gemmobacter megaterium]SIS82102.1 leucyl aminopeptidase [Gemmobacter megaterium]
MTDPHRLAFAPADADALPLHVVRQEDAGDFLAGQPLAARTWLEAQGWTGAAGDPVLLAGDGGAVAGAVMGLGDATARARQRFAVARAAAKLPAGVWTLKGDLTAEERDEAALGWLLAGYRFDRYRSTKAPGARLVAPDGCDARRIEVIANAEALTRDLINTPAADMGPAELQAAVVAMAERHAARLTCILGDDLLAQNLPMIHAVGRASPRAPRLLDLRWGDSGPSVTLVGKGVCFDTGGLDLKPASGLLLMKKDMGGAATVIGLAEMIMATRLPVRLRVLIPAVENAVSGNAMRPRDILTSRKGLTVEVNNTDAEGRLVLADAMALACEDAPDLLVTMATLTGAARVALGADLPPYYTDDDTVAQALDQAARRVRDPVWRMPFWDAYEPQIEPGIADLDNAPGGGMAGSITAALFLRRFADAPRYVHFDIYCNQISDAPARPKGGVGQGARALFAALPAVLGV